MATLSIKDLRENKELDSKIMARVYGGVSDESASDPFLIIEQVFANSTNFATRNFLNQMQLSSNTSLFNNGDLSQTNDQTQIAYQSGPAQSA